MIEVVDTDPTGAAPAGRWLVLCSEHNEQIRCVTRKTAEDFAEKPRVWCGGCRAELGAGSAVALSQGDPEGNAA